MYPSNYTTHRQQQAPQHNHRRTRRPFSMRMATKKVFLAALAFTLLGQAQALCACTLVYYTLCQRYDMSEVVVHATALARNVTGDTATYTLDIITLYKAEDGGNYTDDISFTTPASSDDCGVTLNIGEEYLVGLNDSDDDGVFWVWYCHGLFGLWSTVKNEVGEC